ncbi:MAG: hypothetical protein K0M49_02245 [Arenimonas sp.]|nr:hypothetical protein [Rhizobium sp.]MBW8444427.1 hypothetical protein [Arenimonas sp.]
MPLVGKLESPIAKSGITISELSLQTQLKAIRGAGFVHLINPAGSAVLSDGVVRCDDLVTGRTVLSAWTAPAIDTAINGKPSLTFGSAGAGINGQLMRPKRYGDLDVGTGAWSLCMLVKATGTAGVDVFVSPERVANMTAGNYSPYLTFQASGDKAMAPILKDNAGAARSLYNGLEFFNTTRLLLLCATPGVGLTWYVDNWSTARAVSATDAAKAALTDGRFVLGGYGPAYSSIGYSGSFAFFSAHNVDLSLNGPARRDLMTAVGAYGGITST